MKFQVKITQIRFILNPYKQPYDPNPYDIYTRYKINPSSSATNKEIHEYHIFHVKSTAYVFSNEISSQKQLRCQ